MQQVITQLLSGAYGDCRLKEPLAPHTTWKIGGPADVLLIPRTKEQLVEAVKLLYQHQTSWTVLGRGSNMLVADKGIRGIVLKLGPSMETLRFDGDIVYAGGAYSLIKLSVMASKEGLTGFEFFGGIPGTVGGAVYMNAGAHGSDVSRILLRAEVLLPTGELVTMQQADFEYDYRHSLLQKEPGIVTEAVFQLQFGDKKEIIETTAAYKERRLRTQPLQLPCAGSVFRNPEGHFAAKLIEEAGLKGYKVGGAEVSPLHANFIVNTGKATAQDVLTLIEQVQRIVLEKNGIKLVPEVLVVGER
ncbi:UDP-N-acetylmuramate dehydrogenase [Paenibacillus sp. RC67]|uniref:UDP-N-acetylmuramate dehydrogenase n=1 Tax=Paenibacillus sp. RC67 TaxID=3039392 RepID=UPI0024ACFF3F|nr:UDP-N-acetylmuramate dehydrogenase [Paenibacillus sp. RC67]